MSVHRSVTSHGDEYWTGVRIDRDGRRVARKFPTEAEARAWADDEPDDDTPTTPPD